MKTLFDENGNLPKDFDPYRCNRNDDPRYPILFDSDGYLRQGAVEQIRNLVNRNGWGPWCDAVGMIHANRHASATKGSYPTIYYWRHTR